MKWIWCEYEVDGVSQSYPTACPQWEPHSKSYDWPTPFWSDSIVWCCGNMAASHGSRLLNTFYRYEVDLVWVWIGWEVLIISYSMSPVRTPLWILLGFFCSDGMVWGCTLKATHRIWSKSNTFLYVWRGSPVSMKWMGGPNHILQHVPSEKPTENPTTVPCAHPF